MDGYKEKANDKIVRCIIVIGGLLHGLNALLNTNVLVHIFGNILTRLIFVGIAIVTSLVACERDYYLPFLGDCVFPSGLLAPHVTPNGGDTIVNANVPANTKVIYWAAEPCYEDCDIPVMAWDAYKNYTNSGVATSDNMGCVKFMVRGPQAYDVPYKENTLTPHVHYRYLKHNGMFSKIYTVKVDEKPI